MNELCSLLALYVCNVSYVFLIFFIYLFFFAYGLSFVCICVYMTLF